MINPRRDGIPDEIREYVQRPGPVRGLDAGAFAELAEKFSDARLERVVLDDGRRFVLKHLPPEGDWLTRATGGAGRVELLWSSGILDRVESAVDHAIVGCLQGPSGSVIVMRDVSAQLLPAAGPVSRSTSRRLLAGLANLHDIDVSPTPGLCTVGARYRLFSPQFHGSDTGPGQHPMRAAIVSGWQRFSELVPGSVAEAVSIVHGDPAALERALAPYPAVLLHGDAKLENMGLDAERCILIDWGDLTGFGPPEVEVAWYALKGTTRMSVNPDSVFNDYERVSRRKLDPAALDLACLGALAQMGFRMANSATFGRPEPQSVGKSLLDWWTRRVEAVLESRQLDRLPAT